MVCLEIIQLHHFLKRQLNIGHFKTTARAVQRRTVLVYTVASLQWDHVDAAQ